MSGWRAAPLSVIVEFRRGLTYKKSQEVDFSDNPVLRANNVDRETGELNLDDIRYIDPAIEIPDSKLVRPNTLLICTASGSKTHLGKVALIQDDQRFAFGGFMGLLVPSNDLDAKFLFYFTRSKRYEDHIAALSDGANINNLKFKDFGKLQIPLPPLVEQKRIVAVLDQAFAALDRARVNAEANLADAEELFEVGLDNLISKHSGDAARINLGAICTFENGDRGKNYPGRKAFVPFGIPFINAGHLEDGAIDWDAMNYIPEEHFHRLAKGKVRPNDLLFCLRGSLGKFGKVDREGLGAIASSLVIVRAMGDVLTDFLSIYFRSKTCKLMIEDYAGGAAQPNLSAGDLKKFKIALPTLAAQRQAIDEYAALSESRSRLASAYVEGLSDLEELRQSILQRAFAGELT